MTASECLEHRWLNEHRLPLRIVTPTIATTVVTINPFELDCSSDCTTAVVTTTNGHHDSETDESFENHNGDNESLLSSTLSSDSDTDCNKENSLAKSNAKSIMAAAQTTITTIATINGSSASATTNSIFMLDEISTELPVTSSMVMSNGASTCVTHPTNGSDGPKHQMSSLFPDAPTTPKVCRKSSPDSPPSVKALVKKFQLDNQEQKLCTNGGTTKDDDDNNDSGANEEDFCSVRCSVNCMPCGPGCRYFNGRKSIGIDQGIIC